MKMPQYSLDKVATTITLNFYSLQSEMHLLMLEMNGNGTGSKTF